MDHASTPANSTPPTAPVLCPRCGYDQQGTLATWIDFCPTQGTCSECGLAFEWVDVLNPFRSKLKGLVEHAQGFRQLVRWYFRTMSWVVLPGRFWSRVQMHHTVSVKGILNPLLGTFLLTHVISAGLAAVYRANAMGFPRGAGAFWWLTTVIGPTLANPLVSLSSRTLSGSIFASTFFYDRPWIVVMCGVAAFAAAWPALFLVLPFTRATSGLRWAHVTRAVLYPPMLLFLLLLVYRSIDLVILAHYFTFGRSAWGLTAIVMLIQPLMVLAFKIGCLASPLWLATWWYYAITRGWKLESGRILWLLLLLATGLTGTITATYAWSFLGFGTLSLW